VLVKDSERLDLKSAATLFPTLMQKTSDLRVRVQKGNDVTLRAKNIPRMLRRIATHETRFSVRADQPPFMIVSSSSQIDAHLKLHNLEITERIPFRWPCAMQQRRKSVKTKDSNRIQPASRSQGLSSSIAIGKMVPRSKHRDDDEDSSKEMRRMVLSFYNH